MSSYLQPTDIQPIYGGRIHIYVLSGLDTQNIWYRFPNPIKPGRYVRRSSKTTDVDEAIAIAIKDYEEHKVKKHLGITEAKISFQKLYELFDQEMSQNPTSVKYRKFLRDKYLGPYFKKNVDLHNIDDGDITDYIRWRCINNDESNRNNSGGVSAQTIHNEIAYLGYYLRRAFDKRMILRMPKIPTASKIAQMGLPNLIVQPQEERRGYWSEEQDKKASSWRGTFRKKWKNTLAKERGEDIGNKQTLPNHKSRRYKQVVFYMVMTIARTSGLRSVEMRKSRIGSISKWRDKSTGLDYTLIDVSSEMSKVNKHREVVANNLGDLADIWEDYKYEWERFFGRKPEENDYSFPLPNTISKPRDISVLFHTCIRQLDKELGYVLSESDRFGRKGKTISLYSIRKTYISDMLKNPEMNPYVLARAVGTSLHQFRKVYNINLGRVHREVLTKAVVYEREARKKSEDKNRLEEV